MKKLFVNAQWDDEASVWVATSDDIPGLVTEAASLDGLLERVLAVAPELLEENAHLLKSGGYSAELIDICIQSQLRLEGAGVH
jgi:predicted RNase H-like HicB family nuclease